MLDINLLDLGIALVFLGVLVLIANRKPSRHWQRPRDAKGRFLAKTDPQKRARTHRQGSGDTQG